MGRGNSKAKTTLDGIFAGPRSGGIEEITVELENGDYEIRTVDSDGNPHSVSGKPAIEVFGSDQRARTKVWMEHGVVSRLGEPAILHLNTDGSIDEGQYVEDGKCVDGEMGYNTVVAGVQKGSSFFNVASPTDYDELPSEDARRRSEKGKPSALWIESDGYIDEVSWQGPPEDAPDNPTSVTFDREGLPVGVRWDAVDEESRGRPAGGPDWIEYANDGTVKEVSYSFQFLIIGMVTCHDDSSMTAEGYNNEYDFNLDSNTGIVSWGDKAPGGARSEKLVLENRDSFRLQNLVDREVIEKLGLGEKYSAFPLSPDY